MNSSASAFPGVLESWKPAKHQGNCLARHSFAGMKSVVAVIFSICARTNVLQVSGY